MAQININYKIPDGDLCTVITHQYGHVLADVEHCRFRTSFYIENGEGIVECHVFKEKLKLNSDGIPYKHESCPKK